MSGNTVSEVHSPRKRSGKSIGEVAKSCGDSTESSDKYPEHDTREEEDARRSFDVMEIFIELCRDNPTKEGSSDGLGEEESSLWIVSRYHRPIKCRDNHPTEHRSSEYIEIVFSPLSRRGEWIWELIFSENFFIKKPRYKKCGNISRKVVEYFCVPIGKVEVCHDLIFG